MNKIILIFRKIRLIIFYKNYIIEYMIRFKGYLTEVYKGEKEELPCLK